MLKIPEICFSGGEPLVHPDIIPLVADAAGCGFVVRLITNGILLNEDTVISLSRAGLGWCSVSLDGSSADTHDRFRGYHGCFEKATAGLEHLVRHRIPCGIVAVARRELLQSGGLKAIVELGSSMGVDAVRINFPVPMGRYKDHPEQCLTLEERQEVRKLLKYEHVTMESPSEGSRCTAAMTKVNILPNGDVTPCVFVPLSYGNIKTQRFLDIWTAMAGYSSSFNVKGKCPLHDSALRACYEITDRVRVLCG